jgi:hypothetical protein
MSEQTKKHAEQTHHDLEHAERSLIDAGDHASKTGDKDLKRKVERLREQTTEVREDLKKKLDH